MFVVKNIVLIFSLLLFLYNDQAVGYKDNDKFEVYYLDVPLNVGGDAKEMNKYRAAIGFDLK